MSDSVRTDALGFLVCGDLWRLTVQSQYSASPHMLKLVESFSESFDLAPGAETFYTSYFNIDTASGVGLDTWGRILAIGRGLPVLKGEWFGFKNSRLQPFDQAPFFNVRQSSVSYAMSDIMYRRLLIYKAASNIGSGDTASLNTLVQSVFPGKFVCALESGTMQIQLIFSNPLSLIDASLLETYGLLNKPAGVGWTTYQCGPAEGFGFDENGLIKHPQDVITADDSFSAGFAPPLEERAESADKLLLSGLCSSVSETESAEDSVTQRWDAPMKETPRAGDAMLLAHSYQLSDASDASDSVVSAITPALHSSVNAADSVLFVMKNTMHEASEARDSASFSLSSRLRDASEAKDDAIVQLSSCGSYADSAKAADVMPCYFKVII